MMDWSTLAPTLVKFGLPALKIAITAGVGAIPVVGGFAAPFVADAVGKLIADQFGVPATPDAVSDAIRNAPPDEALAKLQAAQAEAVARWPALARMAEAEEATAQTQIKSTTEQMKTEVLAASTISADSPWKDRVLALNAVWRPLFALEFLMECTVFFFVFMSTLILSDKFDVDSLLQLQTIILAYIGMRGGLIGYHMNLRTREKESVTEAVTDSKPVSMDDIKNMLKGSGVKVK
jgi:hypothetical protein